MAITSAGTLKLREISDLPAPRGLPLIGNAHQLTPSRVHLILERWARELGTPYRFQIGSRPVTVWDDTELCHSIMRERPNGYRRYSPIEENLDEMGSNGVFSVEGAAWEPQRKLVMQALSVAHIKAFYPTMAAITERLRVRWERAARSNRVIEMTEDLKRYTVDVTSALAFGDDPGTLEQDGNVIQEHLALIFPMLMNRINAPFPYWRYVKLPRDHRLDHALAEVHRYVRLTINRARERIRDRPHDEPCNLLEAMLQFRDTPGSGITDDQVAANVLTMLLAGEDTTAHSIAWALLYLSSDDTLQSRVSDQSRAVLGAAGVCPTYETLKTLDLCEAVCTEASRFRPVIPIHAFEPLQDVEHRGIHLPAGSRMFFLTRPSMLDASNFEHPDKFDPERWMHERTPQRGAHETRAHLQFGGGPRVCPGRHLSTVEMRLVISMLSAGFVSRLAVDMSSIREVTAFTMVPSGMPVRLCLRP
ncbi:cytochrome P450 [Paraburkholderia domus]|uniref:cytochrome P450 n=1 Tax=Paraburkholderia domus TaxID=2793075 RepID=UPI0019136E27|nr:cytochrome P450 [Paraburkholderia domus]MBK5060423.1 cytochrome P450 [Burkholderia sp. R-70199]MBK5182580.1 cytochrome P450 [Burkholderia sp. R-69749]CAE6847906.1 Epi-isozizaene 5-monooxygenase/(E)-beta-farnesene synthase [Paraburkholderia domus]CAE6861848.1 Epi-isozizaene 5-monooxygenase/(E)-beta-farnesene synthase [Paraburkholderia domus]